MGDHQPVRVRFAPSPTGHLHIGGVRTALFNYLFARHHGGVFILRIEDTDRSRSTEESIQAILEGLQWLGLHWDEGPYRQTDRFPLYRAAVERLLAEGKAYYCYCTPEELEERRKQALAEGRTPRYDGRCRDRKEPVPGRTPAVRFRAPQEGQTVVEDLVKGRVVFENAQLDDLILLRSDGTPTYNLCVVVDDAEMRITHVIRGDDHLNNTPRQIQLYQALGYAIPQFAHLPMILGPDRTRLSKRHGATSIEAYREEGYLPEALLNYLARLGWSYGDQEVFTLEELIEKFSLDRVGKSAAVFNPEKLLWLNGYTQARMDPRELARRLIPYLEKEGLVAPGQSVDLDWLSQITLALRERTKTLREMARTAVYFFTEKVTVDPEARARFLTPETVPVLERMLQEIRALEDFQRPTLEALFARVREDLGLKMGQVAQPLRVAFTGRTVSPGIYEVMEILGKERCIQRLEAALVLARAGTSPEAVSDKKEAGGPS